MRATVTSSRAATRSVRSVCTVAARASHHPISQHPLRKDVAGVLHGRPFPRLDALPCAVTAITTTHKEPFELEGVVFPMFSQRHLLDSATRSEPPSSIEAACVVGRTREEAREEHSHLSLLCEHFLVPPPEASATFFTADLGGAGRLRWEQNTEVSTYTFLRPLPEEGSPLFEAPSLSLSAVPAWWLHSLPGRVVAATHIAVVSREPPHPTHIDIRQYSPHFNRSSFVTAASVDDGDFRLRVVVWLVEAVPSRWQHHAPVGGRGLDAVRQGLAVAAAGQRTAAGKVVQRLIELDKYRSLALMAQPLARSVSPRVDALQAPAQLQGVNDELRRSSACDLEGQRRLLDGLLRLTATALRVQEIASYRFSAAAAYAKIVEDRVSFLRLGRLEGAREPLPDRTSGSLGSSRVRSTGAPSLESFLMGALQPAMRSCSAMSARLASVAASSRTTIDLLRARLTVEQQAQNVEQLEQLKETARTQLLLQECVEGLSVVAITYYSTGVLGYAAKAAHTLGYLPVQPEVALGCGMPLVGVGVWVALHRLKHSVLGERPAAPPTQEPRG
ncbi:hypothetical protein EMIHUDRAFT_457490 [Emiliania huxleyi CCMP1516]|uniref:DUF3422 domain-containing protein n=2 Tax=Emiliania huxleyi TaxID=2903 RepID=A0A0D3JQ47_EMIH1|nr:hypothetical protein EMIHUDRAFT_457490 [Emiliania huxleyi CCMP1516]EOD25632.1 hypothetical protein EMIHUDRAFT_457490 [Emiliania huxleyi CCMP1516]|eukprot:XP_005778061.1 hypothetical protein EMIHUDRAFT_457490 [Emiliania huxleyi CCMP1516]